MEINETPARRFSLKHLIIIIIVLVIILAVIISISQFTFKKFYNPPTALVLLLPRFRLIDMDNIGITSDKNLNGINDQEDILLGAKKQIEIKAKNIFAAGTDQTNYYNGGDPPADLALCTDIIARAFKEAGFDLRDLVNQDIINNFNSYPLRQIWGQTVADPNIDYRRIQNMEIFFKRNASILDINFNPSDYQNLNSWLPGDVIFFDMDKDGYSDNVGILSDNTTRRGVLKVIYNYIDPGYTVEKDILGTSRIMGHYRFPK
ncbi:MAG: DUF1287 domain-containing protein [Actinobacteria bacterium]|nr:DUF1287 domain-containing protein [Actinomycetota bacterium]